MEPEQQSDPITMNIDRASKNDHCKRSYDEIFGDDAPSYTNAKRSTFNTTPSREIHTTDIPLYRNSAISVQPANESNHEQDKSQGFGPVRLFFPNREIPKNIYPKDEFICKNIEMFLPSTEDGKQAQLGFRCVHCARQDKKSVDNSIIFPSSIEEMENSLYLMIERHFQKCPSLPESVQRSLLELKTTNSEMKQPDSQLKDILAKFCKNANIVNRVPHQTGVVSNGIQIQAKGKELDNQSTSYRSPKNNSLEQYPAFSQTLGSSFDHSIMDQYSTPSSQQYKYQRTAYLPNPFPQVGHEQAMLPNPFPQVGHEQARYDIPFIQTDHNTWECRNCLNQAIGVRAEKSVWYASSPPDPMFIDQHLRMCSGRLANPNYPSGINMFSQNQYTFQQGYPSQRQPHFHPMNYQLGVPSSTYAQGMNASSNVSNYNNRGIPNTFQWRIPPGPMDPTSTQNYTLWNAKVILQREELRYNTPGTSLVQEEDEPLITDYFCHIMKQLRICHFMEKDRATRGGKRTNIKVGYGGLECIHCSLTSNPRKFFWSDVNRLSNSFAEIPTHVLRCSSCPDVVKQALLTLKEFHPIQMADKQRGYQKTYLRRVWKRIHHDDDKDKSPSQKVQSSPESAIPGLDSIDSLGSDSPENGTSGASLTKTGEKVRSATRPPKDDAVQQTPNSATPITKLPDLPEPRIL
jgi:hypothetical protein